MPEMHARAMPTMRFMGVGSASTHDASPLASAASPSSPSSPSSPRTRPTRTSSTSSLSSRALALPPDLASDGVMKRNT